MTRQPGRLRSGRVEADQGSGGVAPFRGRTLACQYAIPGREFLGLLGLLRSQQSQRGPDDLWQPQAQTLSVPDRLLSSKRAGQRIAQSFLLVEGLNHRAPRPGQNWEADGIALRRSQ